MKRTKTEQPMSLSWNPVLRGNTYCSPACGSGCTVFAYRDARTRAEFTARALGHGWTVHVHENMGWFAAVVSPCRRIRVSVPTRNGLAARDYTAYMDTDRGTGMGIWVASSRYPRTAVRAVVAMANKQRDLLIQVCREAPAFR